MVQTGAIAQLLLPVHLNLVHHVVGQQVGLRGGVEYGHVHVGDNLLGGTGRLPDAYIVEVAFQQVAFAAELEVEHLRQSRLNGRVQYACLLSINVQCQPPAVHGDGDMVPLLWLDGLYGRGDAAGAGVGPSGANLVGTGRGNDE